MYTLFAAVKLAYFIPKSRRRLDSGELDAFVLFVLPKFLTFAKITGFLRSK